MAHEIGQHDNVILHRERAWHGLGIVVDDAPTPRKGLLMAGLNTKITQRRLYCRDENGNEVEIKTHLANYRQDIGELMGIVGSNYQPIQNEDMADFCEALVDNGDVRCETVGSIQNGKRVWFLLQGKEFAVANGDGMFPYILVSNGHDGFSPFRLTPTTVRVVCSNTMHMVIPRADTGELLQSAMVIKHTTNVMQRVEEAKEALKNYGRALEQTKELANSLAKRDVKSEEVQEFFLQCYTADFGDVPVNPTNKKEERRRDKAMSAYNSFTRRFDDERGIAGASLWNCINAYSGLVQHDLKARGKQDADRIERRVESNLFGLNSMRTQNALRLAFQMAN